VSREELSYAPQRLLFEGDLSLFKPDLYDLGLLLVALVTLAAALVPRLVSGRWVVGAPLLFMAAGALAFAVPFEAALPDLVEETWWPKRLTELGVIVALTGAGLRLERPFAWETWRVSWRLLAVTMPLTIAAAALLGWWALGLAPAAALLLGAVIAPTDPVLASDVQTSPPGEPDDSEARLALTTEAGLNDGLAFPFTNLAIAVALAGLAPAGWLAGWLAIDVAYKIAAGALIGAAAGRFMAVLVFRLPIPAPLVKTMTGILALSLTLLPYAAAELASGYGFIAVFVAACVFRQVECDCEYLSLLHDFSEELERLLVAVLMFLIGAYAVRGALAALSPALALGAFALVFLVRPLAGIVALPGLGLPRAKQWALAFFGIRGIGSLYYLAYAIHHAPFPEAETLWALVLATVILSVLVHGVAARPVMAAVTGARGGSKPRP
jgi:sodium/hydrogen antiporter